MPKAVRELAHPFPYNDPDALDQLLSSKPGQFAAEEKYPMRLCFCRDCYAVQVIDKVGAPSTAPKSASGTAGK